MRNLSATFLMLLSTILAGAADFPKPTGKFTFDGKSYVGAATLEQAVVTNNSLYLSGEYTWPGIIFRPLKFDYDRFTVVAKLRPEKVSDGGTLLVGGLSCRWFVLQTDAGGNVELSFNNHEFRHTIANLVITNGEWITFGLSFDNGSKRAIVYRNGKMAEEIALPEAFVLDIPEQWRESDKVLTFTDGSIGRSFDGFAAGLLTFNEALSAEQIRKLFPRR
jgi:hypothetical protein